MSFEFIVTPSPWTEERVAQFRVLHASGISFAAIAAALGNGLTRNACIGKAKRIGLVMRGPSVPRKPKPLRIRLYDAGPRKSPMQNIIEQPIYVPQCEPVSFMDLGEHDCSYPVTDDRPFLFCGADTHGEHSYCGFHYSIAYAPPPRVPSRAAQEIRNRRMAQMRKGLAA